MTGGGSRQGVFPARQGELTRKAACPGCRVSERDGQVEVLGILGTQASEDSGGASQSGRKEQLAEGGGRVKGLRWHPVTCGCVGGAACPSGKVPVGVLATCWSVRGGHRPGGQPEKEV